MAKVARAMNIKPAGPGFHFNGVLRGRLIRPPRQQARRSPFKGESPVCQMGRKRPPTQRTMKGRQNSPGWMDRWVLLHRCSHPDRVCWIGGGCIATGYFLTHQLILSSIWHLHVDSGQQSTASSAKDTASFLSQDTRSWVEPSMSTSKSNQVEFFWLLSSNRWRTPVFRHTKRH